MRLLEIGILMIFIGVFLIVLSTLLSLKNKGKVEYGGVVFIGPIPIVFGSNQYMIISVLIVALIILMILLVIK